MKYIYTEHKYAHVRDNYAVGVALIVPICVAVCIWWASMDWHHNWPYSLLVILLIVWYAAVAIWEMHCIPPYRRYESETKIDVNETAGVMIVEHGNKKQAYALSEIEKLEKIQASLWTSHLHYYVVNMKDGRALHITCLIENNEELYDILQKYAKQKSARRKVDMRLASAMAN